MGQLVASPSTGDEEWVKERGKTCKPLFLGIMAKPSACSSWIVQVVRALVSTWRAPQLKVWPVWPGSWRVRLGDCVLVGRGGCEPTNRCYPVHVRPGATPQACRGHRTGPRGGLGTNLHSGVASATAFVTASLHLCLSPCCVIGELHPSSSGSSGQCLTSLDGLSHRPDTRCRRHARTVELGDGRCAHVQPVASNQLQP